MIQLVGYSPCFLAFHIDLVSLWPYKKLVATQLALPPATYFTSPKILLFPHFLSSIHRTLYMIYLTRFRTHTPTHTRYTYRLIPSPVECLMSIYVGSLRNGNVGWRGRADLGFLCYCIPSDYHGCYEILILPASSIIYHHSGGHDSCLCSRFCSANECSLGSA